MKKVQTLHVGGGKNWPLNRPRVRASPMAERSVGPRRRKETKKGMRKGLTVGMKNKDLLLLCSAWWHHASLASCYITLISGTSSLLLCKKLHPRCLTISSRYLKGYVSFTVFSLRTPASQWINAAGPHLNHPISHLSLISQPLFLSHTHKGGFTHSLTQTLTYTYVSFGCDTRVGGRAHYHRVAFTQRTFFRIFVKW